MFTKVEVLDRATNDMAVFIVSVNRECVQHVYVPGRIAGPSALTN